MDETVLTKIKDAELKARQLIDAALKRKEAVVKDAQMQAARAEIKETEGFREKLDKKREQEAAAIRAEAEAVRAAGAKESAQLREAGKKNLATALDHLSQELASLFKGERHAVSRKNA